MPRLLRRFVWLWVVVLGTGLLTLAGVALVRARLNGPEPTLMVVDRHERFIGEISGPSDDERLGFWPIGTLPPRVAMTTLAVEDQRFYQHPGVDPLAIARAIRQNVEAGRRISGASTVAMQLARLQNPGPRNYLQKSLEAVTALMLVTIQGRDAVLKHYLTLAPYGNNVHGIKYAARRYFNKPVDDLSWAETAFLCALPQAPGTMNPYTKDGRSRALKRARRILTLLHARGRLLDAEYEQSLVELTQFVIPPRPERPAASLHLLLGLQSEFDDTSKRRSLVSDPIVRLSVDLDEQERIQRLLGRAVAGWQHRGAGNAAAVVAERVETEAGVEFVVRASVGSTDWFAQESSGSIDYTQALRHPGSALKPFIFALAHEEGLMHSGTVLDDLARGPDGIRNADRKFLGPMLPRQALGNSRNVPAVALAQQVGLARLLGLYERLGLKHTKEPLEHYGLSLALGGMPVQLTDLVQAYTTLQGDGALRELRFYRRQIMAAPLSVFSPGTARVVSGYLSDPLARLPSFPRMGHSEFPFAAAVKTGTSVDYRDAWTVAYSRRFIVGVWVGHPDWSPMKSLAGYSAAAPLAHQILAPLHGSQLDGLSDGAWPSPDGFVAAEVCRLTGQLATPGCAHRSNEWFSPQTVPMVGCKSHGRGPRAASGQSPGLSFAPKYADWAHQQHMLPDGGLLKTRRNVAVKVSVTSPRAGVSVAIDPEAPTRFSSVALRGVVDPPSPQALWYVDGKPFQLVDYPYSARWPVKPGRHAFELRVPYVAGAESTRVEITVASVDDR